MSLKEIISFKSETSEVVTCCLDKFCCCCCLEKCCCCCVDVVIVEDSVELRLSTMFMMACVSLRLWLLRVEFLCCCCSCLMSDCNC